MSSTTPPEHRTDSSCFNRFHLLTYPKPRLQVASPFRGSEGLGGPDGGGLEVQGSISSLIILLKAKEQIPKRYGNRVSYPQ